MVPLSLPALGAIAIILFLATWNSYFWPLIVATDIEVLTIPLGLVYLIDITIANSIGLQWEKAMVVATISILPLLLTFLLAQRQFIAGLTSGGVKGIYEIPRAISIQSTPALVARKESTFASTNTVRDSGSSWHTATRDGAHALQLLR